MAWLAVSSAHGMQPQHHMHSALAHTFVSVGTIVACHLHCGYFEPLESAVMSDRSAVWSAAHNLCYDDAIVVFVVVVAFKGLVAIKHCSNDLDGSDGSL